MQCDKRDVNGQPWCWSPAKWWYRQDGTGRYMWHPRCGVHARIPGNSKAERIAISEPDPNAAPSGSAT